MEVEIITSDVVIPCLESKFGPVTQYLRHPSKTVAKERDSQRKRVYQSETAYEEQHGSGNVFKTIEECQAFADQVTESEYWKTHFPYIRKVFVRRARGKTAHAIFNYGLIMLPKHFYNELTILHELAHHLVPVPHADHGPLWCAVYIDLVREFLGDQKAKQLSECFAESRVKYEPIK